MIVRRFLALSCVLLVAVLVDTEARAGGRPGTVAHDWFGNINGGYAFTTGTTSDFLDDNWTVGGGVMYWPSSWPAGIALDINYWQMDLSSESIRAINDAIDTDPNNDGLVTDGDFETWQISLNGIWSLGADPNKGLYLLGGISWSNVTGTVTEEGLVYFPPSCDPWFWWCYPGGVGPGTILVGEQSSDELGWNVGLGYSFGNIGITMGQVYLELRYQRVEFENESLEYIPLTFGYRW